MRGGVAHRIKCNRTVIIIIYHHTVEEKIDELVTRKIPQIVRAESARFIVPIYSSVSSQPPYEIHLLVNSSHCLSVIFPGLFYNT